MAAPAGSNGLSIDKEGSFPSSGEASAGPSARNGREHGAGEDWTDSTAATTGGAGRGVAVGGSRKTTLPTELMDHILTFVNRAGYSSSDKLTKCCLVSRTFLALARPYLYEALGITIHRVEEVAGTSTGYSVLSPSYFHLYHRLVDQPALAKLVKHIALYTPCTSTDEVQSGWNTLVDDERLESWIKSKRVDVPLLLSSLPNLVGLDIDEAYDGGQTCTD
ncbi:hypothetical protein JCM10213_003802 [Rhodosporidiobolus nylandii]